MAGTAVGSEVRASASQLKARTVASSSPKQAISAFAGGQFAAEQRHQQPPLFTGAVRQSSQHLRLGDGAQALERSRSALCDCRAPRSKPSREGTLLSSPTQAKTCVSASCSAGSARLSPSARRCPISRILAEPESMRSTDAPVPKRRSAASWIAD